MASVGRADLRAGPLPVATAHPALVDPQDAQAVALWIAARCLADGGEAAGRPNHTRRSYSREALRFLLWLRQARGRGLAEASLPDAIAYRDFVSDPQPRAQWCAPRGAEIGTPEWRPFQGPLSPRSRRQSLTVLKSLYRFLQDHGRVGHNPFSGLAMPRGSQPRLDAGRSLTQAQWQAVCTVMNTHACVGPRRRQLAWAVRLLYATGLRASEICAARCADLSWVALDPACAPGAPGTPQDASAPAAGEGSWVLSVVGKGCRLRDVPVPSALVRELDELVALSGDGERARDAPQRPLLLRWQRAGDGSWRAHTHAHGALGCQALYRQLKRFLAEVADTLARRGAAADAAALRRASTHWLRHTHGTHALAAGVPLDVVRVALGHASLAMTTVYTTPELARRIDASRWLRSAW